MHVGMYHHAAYHSAANFRDLDSFIPERWLPGSQYESDRKEILQPFAFGPRNCVGKRYVARSRLAFKDTYLFHNLQQLFSLQPCPARNAPLARQGPPAL